MQGICPSVHNFKGRCLVILGNGFFRQITMFCCSKSISECKNGFNMVKTLGH